MKFLVKKIKHKKNTGKWKKILEKSGKSQGILSARKSGNPVYENKENWTGQGSSEFVCRSTTGSKFYFAGIYIKLTLL